MKTFLRITSILMIIGGAVSIALTLLELFFSVAIVSIGGNGTWLILYPVFAIIASISELVAGIFGIRACKKNQIWFPAVLMGLITIGLNVAVILIAMFPLAVFIPWFTWVLSLIIPVLFTLFALIRR